MSNVFECRKCGHCCEGEGGIVLSSFDLARLASFLNLETEEFEKNYVERHGLKLRLRAAQGGCVFFKSGEGCSVHSAKPDICRAWPFFKGNLEDDLSLEMAKEYCNGIRKDCSFEEFARAGRDYLKNNGLLRHLEKGSAESLKIDF